ncbi:uncharacterized protein LOC122084665 [Macadamia integrifolia]|uniref:uncharacterized protein LOC122084665 n=1 Tax=Macadamia integrifolia TaxID=60698 RepID=UPI001C4FE117|nr:uncharacterized protein LOC122084665 [Macadamia integrifolia]
MSSSASTSIDTASPASPKPSTPNEIADNQNPQLSDHPNASTSEEYDEDDEGGEEDEEEGECPFCLFMKGGGCRDEFIAWENCIEDAENHKEDIVEKCFEVTSLLKKCMEAHSDYYEPILNAEKTIENEASEELEQEISAKQ